MNMASIKRFMLCAFVGLLGTIQAFPTGQRQQPISRPHAVECDKIENYTTTWFLLNTLPEHRREIDSKALFYTKGMSKPARELACSFPQRYVTVWDIWPKYLYSSTNTSANALRCIHTTPELDKIFYENMSEAYARMARKRATIMHASHDFKSPPVDGIWGRKELPAIQSATDIFVLDKINQDQSVSEVWNVPGKAAQVAFDRAIEELSSLWGKPRWADLRKRETCGSCAIWDAEVESYLDSLF